MRRRRDSPFFLRWRSLSISSSFSRSFLAAALSSCDRARSPGRLPVDGVGASVETAPGRPGEGRAAGDKGRKGPFPAGRRAGAIRPGTPARGWAAPLPPCPGNASPGRGATPGRPGRPLLGPGEAEAGVVGGGGRRTIEGCPAGTGRNVGIDSGARRGGGSVRGGAGSATGRDGAGRGGAWVEAAGREGAPVTGRRRWTGGGGGAAGLAGAGSGAGALAGGAAAAGGGGLALAGAGAFAAGLSRTLRTRSAIWSGTTLNWFFASNTPPRRSLKSVVSSFEVSPTSLASSKIRTFPAKFTLERVRARVPSVGVRGAPTDGLAPLGNQRFALIGGNGRRDSLRSTFFHGSLLNHIRPQLRQAPGISGSCEPARRTPSSRDRRRGLAACVGRPSRLSKGPKCERSARARAARNACDSRRRSVTGLCAVRPQTLAAKLFELANELRVDLVAFTRPALPRGVRRAGSSPAARSSRSAR